MTDQDKLRGPMSEAERLKRIIAKELSENDELGSEFVYVQALKSQLAQVTKERDELQRECAKHMDTKMALSTTQARIKSLELALENANASLNHKDAAIERLVKEKSDSAREFLDTVTQLGIKLSDLEKRNDENVASYEMRLRESESALEKMKGEDMDVR